jgi:hypothetical protein
VPAFAGEVIPDQVGVFESDVEPLGKRYGVLRYQTLGIS